MSQRTQNILWLIVLGLVVTLLVSNRCHSHEQGVPFADWFNSRKQPDSPSVSCCGEADQYYTRSYAPSGEPDMAFHAIVEGKDGSPDWAIEIPAKKVDWNSVNPTGRGVVFIGTGEGGGPPFVYCFIPGTGA